MSAESLDHVFKILLIGDAGVGKSRLKLPQILILLTKFYHSILLQFTDGYFNDNLQSTIGKESILFDLLVLPNL
jgi:hypothetical protein